MFCTNMINAVTAVSHWAGVQGQDTRKVWDTIGRRRGCGRGCLTTVGQRPLTVADVSAASALPASVSLT